MDLYLTELKNILTITSVPFKIFVFEKPNVNRLDDGSATKDGIHMIIGLFSIIKRIFIKKQKYK